MKYYIIDKDSLTTWGHEDGVDTKEEVVKLLEEAGEEADRLIVIEGSEVTFTVHQRITLDE